MGKLTPIEAPHGIEVAAQKLVEAHGLQDSKCYYNSPVEHLVSELPFIEVNGKLYEIDEVHLDPYGDCLVVKNDDGTIEFFAHYYNGGGSLEEVLEDEMKRAGVV